MTLAILGIVGFFALLGVLWLERRSVITLPKPTGPFAVSRTTYVWGDESPDTLSPIAGMKRKVFVWMWYPAVNRPAQAEDYLPSRWRAAIEGTRGGLIKILTRDFSKVHPHSLRAADISPQLPSYPVVIFRAGASAQVTNYTTLLEDLASYGYIVVGIDAPYRTTVVVFPEGGVVERTPDNNPELVSGQDLVRRVNKLMAAWTSDMSFVLDQLERLNSSDTSGRFTGRLDMTRVGVFGHSFGGAQAAQFCHEDSRCRAGIDIDGAPFGSVIQTGLHQPFMFLLSSKGDFSTNTEISKIQADVKSIYDRLPADGRLCISIRGANHFTFSDDGALLKSRIMRRGLHVFGKLDIDGSRQLAVTAYCVHSFFDEHLKQASHLRSQISPQLYPELEVFH